MSIGTTSAPVTENKAALKANGAASQPGETSSSSYTPPTSIFEYVNQNIPWRVILSDQSQSSSFTTGTVFTIVAISDSEARIEFSNPSSPTLDATFSSSTGVLSYKVNTVESGEIFLLRGDAPSLSGVSYVGDPEPVAVWGADEDGGGGS